MELEKVRRPGYFGRRRDEKIYELNEEFGRGLWTLVWDDGVHGPREFVAACRAYYEPAYHAWFGQHPEEVDFICQNYSECMDNAITNIRSGCDYGVQEAFSTHIQDIAIRNVLRGLGRKFEGKKENVLVIRSADTEGFKYGPGNIPFLAPERIEQPSKRPRWANEGSVEDFWQSNKYIAIKK